MVYVYQSSAWLGKLVRWRP